MRDYAAAVAAIGLERRSDDRRAAERRQSDATTELIEAGPDAAADDEPTRPRPQGGFVNERTLVLVKPDGVQRLLVGRILGRFEERGLKLVGLKLVDVDRDLAERHYAVHREKPFFAGLVEFITSSPLVAAAFEGPNAIAVVRSMVGATRPHEAAPGTIRGDFALETAQNLIHASDGAETAADGARALVRARRARRRTSGRSTAGRSPRTSRGPFLPHSNARGSGRRRPAQSSRPDADPARAASRSTTWPQHRDHAPSRPPGLVCGDQGEADASAEALADGDPDRAATRSSTATRTAPATPSGRAGGGSVLGLLGGSAPRPVLAAGRTRNTARHRRGRLGHTEAAGGDAERQARQGEHQHARRSATRFARSAAGTTHSDVEAAAEQRGSSARTPAPCRSARPSAATAAVPASAAARSQPPATASDGRPNPMHSEPRRRPRSGRARRP